MTVEHQQSHGLSFLTDALDPAHMVIPDDMGDDERMMMGALRDFATQEVAPVLDRIEQRDEKVILPLFRKAAELGIFMAEVPEEYGGLELNLLAIVGMSEARSHLGGLASTVFLHQGIGTLPLINFGTPAQIDRYLRRCMDGQLMAAFALTEPSSGSDAMNIRTTATLDNDGRTYIVNGSKQWITNAGWADLFILFAKVDGTEFTAFLLERDSSGLSVGPHEHLLGLHGSSVCSLSLDNVRVPVENVLGEVGKGHKVALCTLNLGRMKMAANCAGTSKKALATAVEYALDRHQFGQPIAEFGLIQTKLANMAARAYATESVAYRTAGLVYAKAESAGAPGHSSLDAKLSALTEFAAECAIAKVFGSEAYNALADDMLQVFGGNGFSEDYPAARTYRDARITRIYEGTSEICRLTIAKTILKRVAKGELVLDSRHTLSTGDGSAATLDGAFARLVDHIDAFREVFGDLLNSLVDRIGIEGLRANDKQPYLSSLADIAIEIYAAESTVSRVLRLRRTRPGAGTDLPEALARLTFSRSADRIRDEATQILAGLYDGADLQDALVGLARKLPLPQNLVHLRQVVARGVIERKGQLPSFPPGPEA